MGTGKKVDASPLLPEGTLDNLMDCDKKLAKGVLDLSTIGTREAHHFRYDQEVLRYEPPTSEESPAGRLSGPTILSPKPKPLCKLSPKASDLQPLLGLSAV